MLRNIISHTKSKVTLDNGICTVGTLVTLYSLWKETKPNAPGEEKKPHQNPGWRAIGLASTHTGSFDELDKRKIMAKLRP
jgi:hypothetical protein